MGIFSGPQTVNDHLARIDKRVEHTTSNTQKALLGLGAGINIAGNAVIVGGGALAYDAYKRDPNLFNVAEHQTALVSRDGRNFKLTASLVDKDKLAELVGKIAEGLEPGKFFSKIKIYAKANPATATALAAATVGVTGLQTAYSYGQTRNANDAEIGDSVRKLRKIEAQSSPGERERIEAGLAGRSWSDKVKESPSSSAEIGR